MSFIYENSRKFLSYHDFDTPENIKEIFELFPINKYYKVAGAKASIICFKISDNIDDKDVIINDIDVTVCLLEDIYMPFEGVHPVPNVLINQVTIPLTKLNKYTDARDN